MKKLIIGGITLLCILGATAHAATFELVTASGVERSKDSEPVALKKDFALNSKVFAFVVMSDLADDAKNLQAIEARWYACNRLVSKRNLVLNEAFEQSAKPKADDRHHAWFWIDAKPMGPGQHRVEVLSKGQVMASSNFNVRNETGDSIACANAEQTYTLADDASGESVLFKFNRSQEADLYGAAQVKLDEIAQSLKANYESIDKMVALGHTDRLGNDAYNLKLSQERADTIKNALLRRGVVARETQAIGQGETSPVQECADTLAHESLIECLAPNRRVEIKVQGKVVVKN